jgi:hypothetical protein
MGAQADITAENGGFRPGQIAQQAIQSLAYGQGGAIDFNWRAAQDWVVCSVIGDKPIVFDSVRTHEPGLHHTSVPHGKR